MLTELLWDGRAGEAARCKAAPSPNWFCCWLHAQVDLQWGRALRQLLVKQLLALTGLE